MSVGFVASKGARFAAELPKQREETDRRVKAFNDAVGRRRQRVAHRRARRTARRRGGRREDRSTRCASASRHSRFPAPEAGAAYTQAIGSMIWHGRRDRRACPPIPASCARSASMRRWCAARNSPARSAPQARAALPRAASAPPTCAASWRSRASQEQQFDVVRRQGSAAQQDALKGGSPPRPSVDVARMREAAITLATGETKDRGRGARMVQGLDRADRRVEEGRGSRRLADLKAVASAVSSQAASTLMARARDVDRPHLGRVVRRLCGGALDHPAARHAGRHDADARRRRHRRRNQRRRPQGRDRRHGARRRGVPRQRDRAGTAGGGGARRAGAARGAPAPRRTR